VNLEDISNTQIIKIRSQINEKYAQKPVSTDRRIYGTNKKYIFDNFADRNEFSRDRDRIIFSKAFRRLEHKAQVYSHEKGDHYRTRLTHTIEVMQIARSIARNLGLNEDLTEAIALGHDIGHTAFGHQGEDVLNKIMQGKDDLGGKLKYSMSYGGFKHNFNGLRILDVLERKYPDKKGLNLTWQVIDGILKHTDIEKEDNKWDINRFIRSKDWIKGILKFKNPVTLEGQIVSIADEITQRQHDLDDGLRDKNLGLTESKIIDFIQKTINYKTSNNDSKYFEVKLLEELEENIKNRENEVISNSISEKELDNYKWNSLIRDIIDFFIKDVTLNSLGNFRKLKTSDLIEDLEYKRTYFNSEDKIIYFGELGKQFNDILENFINNQILNSYTVNIFDGKAIYIVRQLFKAYYENPKQMPQETLDKLSIRIQKNSENYCKLKLKNKSLDDLNFRKSYPRDIDKLIQLLKLDNNKEELEMIYKKTYNDNTTLNLDKDFFRIITGNINDINYECEYCDDNFEKKIIYKIFNKVNSLNEKEIKGKKNNISKKLIFVKCLIEHHYAYMSLICDYIAGMTDNYANSEYKKLYLV
jgi:dGTPase